MYVYFFVSRFFPVHIQFFLYEIALHSLLVLLLYLIIYFLLFITVLMDLDFIIFVQTELD